jgi:hypothetical protein
MAFDKAPGTWLTNWAEDGTDIIVPIATFPEMTAAEADAATGDIRKVLYAVCEALHQKWTATATTDRPTKWSVRKSSYVNPITGQTTHTYSHTFVTDTLASEVGDE